MEFKIGKNYKLTSKLGQGAFGQIYRATNITNNAEVALKLEPSESRNP